VHFRNFFGKIFEKNKHNKLMTGSRTKMTSWGSHRDWAATCRKIPRRRGAVPSR